MSDTRQRVDNMQHYHVVVCDSRQGVDKASCYHVLVAAAIKELRAQVLNFMASMVRHYTMVAIAQQCGRSTIVLDICSSHFLSSISGDNIIC